MKLFEIAELTMIALGLGGAILAAYRSIFPRGRKPPRIILFGPEEGDRY